VRWGRVSGDGALASKVRGASEEGTAGLSCPIILGNGQQSKPVNAYERISLGDTDNCANSVGFWGLVPLLPPLRPLSVLKVGYVGKACEKGYLENPGLHAVLTTC